MKEDHKIKSPRISLVRWGVLFPFKMKAVLKDKHTKNITTKPS